MSTISLRKATDAPVFYKQVYFLLALEAAVTTGWFAYENYQPVLLQKFNFQPFIALLLIIQGLLGAVFHPFSGHLADKVFHRSNSKFPVIISGILFATLIFMLVSITLMLNVKEDQRWLIPFLVILWLAAMSTFHSPALSLVESFVPPQKIPFISALLVIAFGVIYALGPVLVFLLDFLGLTATFLLGGILLAVTGYSLKYVVEKDAVYQTHIHQLHPDVQETSFIKPVWLSLTGFFIGLCKGSVLFALPFWLHPQLPIEKNTLEALIMASAALMALPVSSLINTIGEIKVLAIGCTLAILSVFLIFFIRNTYFGYFAIFLGGSTYSLLATAALPFILKRVANTESGSALGLFYGGVSAATASIALLLV